MALAVLLVNDHVLKGSGLLPGVVTGKLSDVAGVIVAPVLVGVVLRVRDDTWRAPAFALALAPFVAVNVSPTAALAWERLLTLVGVASRLWCDPTDLFALLLVPLAWRVSKRARLPDARVLRYGALALASLACVATSAIGPEPVVLQPPFVINWTRVPLRVELAVQADTDCQQGPVEPGAFAESMALRLRPAEIFALGGIHEDAGVMAGECGALRVRVEGGDEVVVGWSGDVADGQQRELDRLVAREDDRDSWRVGAEDEWAFERAVTLVEPSSDPRFVVGTLLEAR